MSDELHSSTHPPLPPTTEDGRCAWLRLLRSRRVGVQTFWRLIGEHGTAQAALDALPAVARGAGVDRYEPFSEKAARAELAAGYASGARLVCRGEADYPGDLATIDGAPPLLWITGDPSVLHRPMIALVGARNASSLGGRMARQLASELGKAGFVVVSGLARGIDTAAHEAALETGTVAVVAGGVDVDYPIENAKLGASIVKHGGARISEAPMGLQPQARHFPARNRIISGMARAVIVVEAASKSGSLITARTALDQGREVLAVPGHPFDGRAGGCNALIRDGARLIRGIDDVLEALPPAAQPRDLQATLPLSDIPAALAAATPRTKSTGVKDIAALHGAILDRLGPTPVAEDQLIRDLGAAPAVVTPAITDLELDGRIHRRPGGLLSRA